MKLKSLYLFFQVLYPFVLLYGQSDADIYSETINRKQLKEHVYILASDSCAGRYAGSTGIGIAADYIIDNWKETVALRPFFSECYFQPLTLVRQVSGNTHFKLNDYSLKVYEDYIYSGIHDNFSGEIPVVFVGYGNKEDFVGLDVKGKAVFVLNNNLRASFHKARIAEDHGAALSIIANPDISKQFETISRHYKNYSSFVSYRLANDTTNKLFPEEFRISYRSIVITNSLVKKLSSHQISYWKNSATPKNESVGKISLKIEPKSSDTIIANNLLAYIPGINDDEFLVIGAHYDHLGMINGEVFPGADDNASGTAALIELAQTFSQACSDGYKPQKNILFIAFTAEEGGLYGSKYFIDQFAKPEQIKLMINIDMIGRSSYELDNISNRFFFVGHNLADSSYKQNDMLCKKYSLSPDYSSSISASDHQPFFTKGIPTIFFFDGKNRDLHKTSDTPDKISYKRMERVTRLIFETAWIQSGMRKETN